MLPDNITPIDCQCKILQDLLEIPTYQCTACDRFNQELAEQRFVESWRKKTRLLLLGWGLFIIVLFSVIFSTLR